MKNLLFLAAALTVANVYAQKSQFGITGGATLANYKIKVSGTNISMTSRAGFTLGVMANFASGNNFSIQPAVNFVQKGTQEKQTTTGVTEKTSLTTNHIEIPVNFIYNSNGFFIGAGPSVAFGISGKSKYDDGTTKTDEKIHYGNGDNDDLKAFDFGVNALTGYNFKSGFSIAANYNLGLSNLAPGSNNDGSLKSMYGAIRLGYWLKTKK